MDGVVDPKVIIPVVEVVAGKHLEHYRADAGVHKEGYKQGHRHVLMPDILDSVLGDFAVSAHGDEVRDSQQDKCHERGHGGQEKPIVEVDVEEAASGHDPTQIKVEDVYAVQEPLVYLREGHVGN